MELLKNADVNGTRQNEYYQIQENDEILITNSVTVRELAEILDVPLGGDIRVNDTPAKPDTKVYENFTVSWNMDAASESNDSAEEDYEEEDYEVVSQSVQSEEQKEVSEQQQTDEAIPVQQNIPRPMSVLVNHMPITMNGKANYVFVDVFDYIDFDLKASGGRSIVTKLNGRPAEYMEYLKDGDVIEIYWK